MKSDQEPEIEKKKTVLNINDPAPDFTLPSHNEGELNLSWYKGRKNVLLAFYPGDWTPVCASQIPLYQTLLGEFDRYDCQLLCISVDSVPCHKAWAKSLNGLSFPLLSDYYPHGAIAQKYGVLTERGYAERAVFLIDKSGIIRFIERVDLAKLPDNDKMFEELEKLEKLFRQQSNI